MKKKLIVVLALIVVIVAALPFLNGVLMEHIVKKAIKDANSINAGNPVGYSVEIVSYKRGYSATDIELKMDNSILKKLYGIESVIISEHAKHGFLGVVSTVSLEDNVWYNSFVNNRLKGHDPLHIKSRYSLFGGIRSDIILDDFSTNIKGENIHVRHSEVEVTTDRKLQKFHISGNLQGFDIGQKTSVGKVSLVSDMKMVSRLILVGDTVTKIKSFKATDKGAEVKISDLKVKIRTDADKDADTLAFYLRCNVGSIRTKGKKIKDASLRLALKGVKLDAYQEVRNLYLKSASQMMAEMALKDRGNMDEKQIRRQMLQMNLKMLGVYEKLLKKGLEIRISDVHVRLPQGEIKGGITLRLLKDMTFGKVLPLIIQPEMLTEVLYIKSYVSLPAELVGENPSMVKPFFPEMKTGLFVKDGDYLVNKMETKDGKLYLNGKPVPLEGLRPRFGSLGLQD